MKLMEWRGDPSLTSDAERVLKNKTIRAMIEVLIDEQPSTRPLPTIGASGTDHAYANGLETGWRSAVETFKVMGTKLPSAEVLPATFADDNTDDYYG